MSRVISYVPRLAIFAAGIVAGVLTSSRREHGGISPAAEQDLKRSLADLESRLEAHESADVARFAQVETRLDEHAVKLADVPSTAQIVAAMEQLLSKTMTSLDERLTTQAHSIEALNITVAADRRPAGTGAGVARFFADLHGPTGVGRGFRGPASNHVGLGPSLFPIPGAGVYLKITTTRIFPDMNWRKNALFWG